VSVLFLNDHFEGKHKAVSGLYGQPHIKTLFLFLFYVGNLSKKGARHFF
jgi:hypothetical protein